MSPFDGEDLLKVLGGVGSSGLVAKVEMTGALEPGNDSRGVPRV